MKYHDNVRTSQINDGCDGSHFFRKACRDSEIISKPTFSKTKTSERKPLLYKSEFMQGDVNPERYLFHIEDIYHHLSAVLVNPQTQMRFQSQQRLCRTFSGLKYLITVHQVNQAG